MALKKFTIKYQNEDKEIEYEDEATFGEIEKILRNVVNVDVGNGSINVNIPEYRMAILHLSLKKAPFPISPDGINSLPWKVVKQINQEIMKSFPLAEYLVDWMTTATGQNLAELSEIALQKQ